MFTRAWLENVDLIGNRRHSKHSRMSAKTQRQLYKVASLKCAPLKLMSSLTDSVQQQTSPTSGLEPGQLAERISELGDWFHNLDLHGVPTAPHHFLGDFPNIKWRQIANAIPQDLTGATVLDVGCNGGFYSLK